MDGGDAAFLSNYFEHLFLFSCLRSARNVYVVERVLLSSSLYCWRNTGNRQVSRTEAAASAAGVDTQNEVDKDRMFTAMDVNG